MREPVPASQLRMISPIISLAAIQSQMARQKGLFEGMPASEFFASTAIHHINRLTLRSLFWNKRKSMVKIGLKGMRLLKVKENMKGVKSITTGSRFDARYKP